MASQLFFHSKAGIEGFMNLMCLCKDTDFAHTLPAKKLLYFSSFKIINLALKWISVDMSS